MADCNKFKKKWLVETSDTTIFPVGTEYKIVKADENGDYEFDFEDPPEGTFSVLTCIAGQNEEDYLEGTYTDTEGADYTVRLTLTGNKRMQGEIGESTIEAVKGKPEDDPVGTWGAEEEPPV